MQCAALTLALLLDVSRPTYYELSGDQVYSGLSEQDSVRSCNTLARGADIIVLQHISFIVCVCPHTAQMPASPEARYPVFLY